MKAIALGSLLFFSLLEMAPNGASLATTSNNIIGGTGLDLPNRHSSAANPRSEEIPTMARIFDPKGNDGIRTPSGCCHVLLFYRLGPTDLPYFVSGNLVLRALTDETTAIAQFGKTPFIRTRNGLRYFLSEDPTFHTGVGEAHRDQCLATFSSLDLPLNTPITLTSGSYAVSDLLNESVANFSFDQQELEWTAIAFSRYIPPKRDWVDRFGERTSFTQLVRHLLALNLNTQSCAGTHLVQALAKLNQADTRYSILDITTRMQLRAYLQEMVTNLMSHQRTDGSWSKKWCTSIYNEDPGTMSSFEYQMLVTGHLLEVLSLSGVQSQVPDAVTARAREWLKHALTSPEIRKDGSWVCPFTHAARMARYINDSHSLNSSK